MPSKFSSRRMLTFSTQTNLSLKALRLIGMLSASFSSKNGRIWRVNIGRSPIEKGMSFSSSDSSSDFSSSFSSSMASICSYFLSLEAGVIDLSIMGVSDTFITSKSTSANLTLLSSICWFGKSLSPCSFRYFLITSSAI